MHKVINKRANSILKRKGTEIAILRKCYVKTTHNTSFSLQGKKPIFK